jgi:xylose isomerase
MLAADPGIKVLIEPKPNEPMDLAYLPTMGHAVATAYLTSDPRRVGALMESAHAILAGSIPPTRWPTRSTTGSSGAST